MEAYNYQFTALRGIQAGREYYVAMCPLMLVPRIFLFDEEEIPAELRAQRVLNRSRVPDIARYIINNTGEYVFSSITACIDGAVMFEPMEEHGYGRNAGILTVPMTSKILINDGQHRRAAIEEALRANPDLGDETISVVFFIDAGLERSQQLFADLNKHAVRPTRSIGILYDHRDPFARLCVELIDKVPIFKGFTETEKTTISNRSSKLFTLSAVYQANQALLGKKRGEETSKKDLEVAIEYWKTLGKIIPEWRAAMRKQVTAAELRKEFVHVHGVTLHALGIVGRSLMETHPDDWQKQLKPLEEINWLRTSRMWEGRAMRNGRMTKAGESVTLTSNVLKQTLSLLLTETEAKIEETLQTARGA